MWYFDAVGYPIVFFEKLVLDTVDVYLKDCTLGEIVLRLGPTEKVILTIVVSNVYLDLAWPSQKFYFPSPGLSYFRECEKAQDCLIVHSGDLFQGEEFYRADTTVTDHTGFNTDTYVYKRHCFDVNMAQAENKMPDSRP